MSRKKEICIYLYQVRKKRKKPNKCIQNSEPYIALCSVLQSPSENDSYVYFYPDIKLSRLNLFHFIFTNCVLHDVILPLSSVTWIICQIINIALAEISICCVRPTECESFYSINGINRTLFLFLLNMIKVYRWENTKWTCVAQSRAMNCCTDVKEITLAFLLNQQHAE